jgi:hypothetical protein
MAEATYILCAATSVFAAALLLRMYLHVHTRLLLWSAVGFAGLAVNNLLMCIDLLVFPQIDLLAWRAASGAIATMTLLVGLIME